jgi:hypothetical protein
MCGVFVTGSRRRLVATIVLLVVIVAGGVLVATLPGTKHRLVPPGEDIGPDARLLQSLRLIGRLTTPDGYPFAVSLVSTLQTIDPSARYEILDAPTQAPATGSIGVYTSAHSLWLRMLGPRGEVVQVQRVVNGTRTATYGPAFVGPSIVADGNFTAPLGDVWSVQRGAIATATRDASVYFNSPASLRVDGTGSKGRSATTVSQPVGQGLAPGAHGIYEVGLLARTRSLSRPLSVELKLVYDDGSYQFFSATSRSQATATTGIPQGTSNGWLPLQIRAVAREHVRSIVLFAADSGLLPLRGTAWIDDIVLSVA